MEQKEYKLLIQARHESLNKKWDFLCYCLFGKKCLIQEGPFCLIIEIKNIGEDFPGGKINNIFLEQGTSPGDYSVELNETQTISKLTKNQNYIIRLENKLSIPVSGVLWIRVNLESCDNQNIKAYQWDKLNAKEEECHGLNYWYCPLYFLPRTYFLNILLLVATIILLAISLVQLLGIFLVK